jgi:hypothetical protein
MLTELYRKRIRRLVRVLFYNGLKVLIVAWIFRYLVLHPPPSVTNKASEHKPDHGQSPMVP